MSDTYYVLYSSEDTPLRVTALKRLELEKALDEGRWGEAHVYDHLPEMRDDGLPLPKGKYAAICIIKGEVVFPKSETVTIRHRLP